MPSVIVISQSWLPTLASVSAASAMVMVPVMAPPPSATVIQSGQDEPSAKVASSDSSSVAVRVKVTPPVFSSMTVPAVAEVPVEEARTGASLISVTVITNRSVAVSDPAPLSVVVQRTL